MLPWSIYNLTPRDQASPLIRLWHEFKSGTWAGTNNFTLSIGPVPEENVLLVTSIGMSSVVVGSSVSSLTFRAYEKVPGSVNHFTHRHVTSLGTNLSHSLCGAPIASFGGGETFDATVLTAGAVTNGDLYFTMAGILVPRGTIALR